MAQTATGKRRKVIGRPFVKGVPRPPNAGRRRGTPNKATKEIKEFFREVMNSEEYRRSLRQRIIEGRAPRIELLGLYWLGGKPKEELSVDHAHQTLADLLAAAHDELRRRDRVEGAAAGESLPPSQR